VACFGLLWADTGDAVAFRGRTAISVVTEDLLGWVCSCLKAEGKKALFLIWYNSTLPPELPSWICDR
jgi:hypothetical protein